MSLSDETITGLRTKLSAGEINPVDIVDALGSAISEKDDAVGGYLAHNLEQARADASAADLNLPLGGVPIAIKDNINVTDEQCTCGSRFLSKGYTSPYDATVARKLKEAGAILYGRTNMDEFAMGSSTENSALQVTRNPHDHSRIPGGSSGGSAAVVASNTAIAALGSDTGGSIRQPASHCGIVGLKPSYGRVSRYGLVAFASSLDQIGPMTKSVEDAARLLQVIAGSDPRDSTCLDEDVPDYLSKLDAGPSGMRIGIPAEYFGEGLDPKIRAGVEAAAASLEKEGAELVELSLPSTEYAVSTYYILAPAEASSNLSRFDGVRYGRRAENPADVLDMYQQSREEGFGPEVKRRIILGTYLLSSGYYDAYYTRAQKVRTLIQREFTDAFNKVDVILSPVSPAPARKIAGDTAEDPLQDYLADIYTISANLAGIAGLSVPCGTASSEDGTELPYGLQFLAPHLGEQSLLRAGRAWEMIR